MKNKLKNILFALIIISSFSACTSDDDTTLPPVINPIYSESFSRPTDQPAFNFEGWTNFSEAGTKKWFLTAYAGNDYLEFSSFQGGASNIGWIVTPEIDLDSAEKKRLIFQSAQHHASSPDNKFEVLVSSDFDGTNVLAATWKSLPFTGPKYTSATNYDFVNSGKVDLSGFSGKIHIAFRVIGNGTTLTGGFQIDNIKVF